jgi:hypothetical protein
MSFTRRPMPWFVGAVRLVAQPDRAPDFESGGCGFESLRDGHFLRVFRLIARLWLCWVTLGVTPDERTKSPPRVRALAALVLSFPGQAKGDQVKSDIFAAVMVLGASAGIWRMLAYAVLSGFF